MTELAAVAGTVLTDALTTLAKAAAPAAAVLLEDLHVAASTEITRLEAEAPAALLNAETDVQNYVRDAVNTIHGLIARISGHASAIVSATPAPKGAVSTPAAPEATAK